MTEGDRRTPKNIKDMLQDNSRKTRTVKVTENDKRLSLAVFSCLLPSSHIVSILTLSWPSSYMGHLLSFPGLLSSISRLWLLLFPIRFLQFLWHFRLCMSIFRLLQLSSSSAAFCRFHSSFVDISHLQPSSVVFICSCSQSIYFHFHQRFHIIFLVVFRRYQSTITVLFLFRVLSVSYTHLTLPTIYSV